MEGISLKLTPVVVRCFLGSLGMFGPLAGSYVPLGLIAIPNSINGGYNLLQATHSPPPPAQPTPSHPPHIHAIIVAVTKLQKIQ